MADQVVLMCDGRIEQDAAPDVLYENPASIFVARFVGTPPMNVLPLSALRTAGAGETIPPPPGLDPESLAVGIRPEQADLGAGGIAGEVVTAEYLGADTLIEARIAGHPFIIRKAGKVRVAQAEKIDIILSQAGLHWFDQASGRKLVRD